ncbi:serine/threonine-protein kinase [Actinomadura parmotrematis]|uniref:Protein kinase n=1 Tax=Actinomadura parmotrematis TaxID=2864039 RepID=A0ABS7FXV5_9ACTN|nr:serine/threonine-protein kinase [Actinomadura parmotrematis]MBW8485263.1 protein kinase [Actinomadura parmotrematis]
MAKLQPLRAGDPASVAGYRLLGRLGEGGQGVVYLGRGDDGRQAAVKVLHPHLVGDEAARSRFLREVSTAGSVARFCTAQIIDAGLIDGVPYIASEYVPGPSLEESLRADGPRTGAALERLALNTATALAAIHRAGVQHRDFKPDNILLGPDGPVVIDFGIARALDDAGGGVTRHGQLIGTPAYLAPEQLTEEPVGPAADVFSWGVTMVRAANGRPAFASTTLPSLFNAIITGTPDLGVLQPPLRDLVAACLAKSPAHRPTADQIVARLTGSAQVVSEPPPFPGLPADLPPFPGLPAEPPPFPGLTPGLSIPAPPSPSVPAAPPPATGPRDAGTMPVADRRPARRRPRWAVPVAAAAGVALLGAAPVALLMRSGGEEPASATSTQAAQAGVAARPRSGTGRAASRTAEPGAKPSASATATTTASGRPSPTASAKKRRSKAPATATGPSGPNLIANAGFNGTAGWTFRGSVTGGSGHTGSGVLLSATSGSDAAIEQHLTLRPHTRYTLTGWARAAGPRTMLGLKTPDPNVGSWRATTSSSWTRFTMGFTTGGAGTTSGTVYCWLDGAGKGSCDDVVLQAWS